MEYYNHRFDVTIKLFCDKPLTNEEYDEKFTVISSFNLNYYKALVLMAGMEV